MRNMTELQAIAREHPVKSSDRPATPGTLETRPMRTEMDRVLTTLGEMERMMEETFRRPLFGMSPFRTLFHELGSHGDVMPTVDIFEQKGEIVVKAELAGMKREDIDVKLVDNTLVLSGEKKSEEKVEKKDFLRVERSFGTFNRTMVLPEGLDTKKIKASFKDGVLEVRIPKVEVKSVARHVAIE